MCPNCKAPLSLSRVDATRRYDTVITRRRQCLQCGKKYLTDEVYGGDCLEHLGDYRPAPHPVARPIKRNQTTAGYGRI